MKKDLTCTFFFEDKYSEGWDWTWQVPRKDFDNVLTSELIKRGVDIVFEHVGKATWQHSLSLLAKGGRIVTCGATTGKGVRIDLAHLFIKQHYILGSTMSSLPTFQEVMKKIHNNIYFPFVDKIYKMKDVRPAHEYIENSQHKGKVVLVV